MKKIFTIFIVLLFAGSLYAKENYKGDIQLRTGIGGGLISIDQTPSTNFQSSLTGLVGEVCTTHLFKLNSVLSLGFSANFSFGLLKTNWARVRVKSSNLKTDLPNCGNGFSFDVLTGPTFAVQCGKVVRFDFTTGLAVGSVASTVNNSAYITSGIGVGFDVKAKFIPNSVVSPLIGYRMSWTFKDKYDYMTSNGTKSVTADNVSTFDNIYAGISINW